MAMQTIIKWAGCKTKEFIYIKDLIPHFERYIEPFFGSGGMFFQLEPKEAIINDICEELTDFYSLLKDENRRSDFKKEMYGYVDSWEKIPEYIKIFGNEIVDLYKDFKENKIVKQELGKNINDIILKKECQFNELFSKKFCLDEKNLLKQIIKNLISKIQRIKEIEQKGAVLSTDGLYKNIETAFRSGFYMHFRDVMNFNGDKYKVSLPKKIANYYFIKEFCYGSMSRFNSKGYFNVAYGGIGYNIKDFRKKVDYIFSNEVKELFRNTIVKNKDFEDFFNEFEFSKKDFIFLDPPYDMAFSDYGKKSFDKKDQERLAKYLYKTKANFILIIKKTDFIYDLYKNKENIKIDSFQKCYSFNIKCRNNRDVEHLIVYNF